MLCDLVTLAKADDLTRVFLDLCINLVLHMFFICSCAPIAKKPTDVAYVLSIIVKVSGCGISTCKRWWTCHQSFFFFRNCGIPSCHFWEIIITWFLWVEFTVARGLR